MSAALLVCAGLLGAPAGARALQQNDTPSLRTEDVLDQPESVTAARAAEPPIEEAATGAVISKAATAGYTRMTVSGYSFERPDGWKPIENLEAAGAPTFFKYDAVLQDPDTGAVISAVSVDQASLETPIDIGNTEVINALLNSMLNPAGVKDGVKLFRQTTGSNPDGSKWLRIKAQGNGQAVDGTVVDTTFWVQFVQLDKRLALVAVGYPTARQNDVATIAFHTVRTLEMENVARPGAAPAEPKPESGEPRPPGA